MRRLMPAPLRHSFAMPPLLLTMPLPAIRRHFPRYALLPPFDITLSSLMPHYFHAFRRRHTPLRRLRRHDYCAAFLRCDDAAAILRSPPLSAYIFMMSADVVTPYYAEPRYCATGRQLPCRHCRQR